MSGNDDKIVTSLIAADAYSETLSNKELKAIFSTHVESTINLFGDDSHGMWRTIAYIIVVAISVFAVIIIRFYGIQAASHPVPNSMESVINTA